MLKWLIPFIVFLGIFITLFVIHDRKNFNTDSRRLVITKFILLLIDIISFILFIIFIFL